MRNHFGFWFLKNANTYEILSKFTGSSMEICRKLVGTPILLIRIMHFYLFFNFTTEDRREISVKFRDLHLPFAQNNGNSAEIYRKYRLYLTFNWTNPSKIIISSGNLLLPEKKIFLDCSLAEKNWCQKDFSYHCPISTITSISVLCKHNSTSQWSVPFFFDELSNILVIHY